MSGGERHRRSRGDTQSGTAGHQDATAPERIPERARREQRRRERGPALPAVDDQSRERWRLAPEEVLLPPGACPSRIVERLVTQHSPGDRADPSPTDRRRESVEVGGGEGRIAESLEDEVSIPRRTGAGADPVNLCVEPVSRPEAAQRREGDGDLLVRGRGERHARCCGRRSSPRSTRRSRAPPSCRARATARSATSSAVAAVRWRQTRWPRCRRRPRRPVPRGRPDFSSAQP